jgi:methyl-accepting chemotaxis protein
MINPNFNPYEDLLKLQEQVKEIASHVRHQAVQIHEKTQLLQQIIDALNKNTEAINIMDQAITDIHNRLRLLEVKQDYEQN